jgi:hypothetical protein
MLSADLYLLNTASVDADQLIRLSSGLSPDERRHWHEIHQAGRQHEYLLGRVLLRRLLAERLHCPADASDLSHRRAWQTDTAQSSLAVQPQPQRRVAGDRPL